MASDLSVSNVVHTTLDGNLLELKSHVPLDLTRPFGSVIHARFGPYFQEFIGGQLSYGRQVAESMELVLDEHYSFAGGSLLIGSKIAYDEMTKLESTQLLGVWEGKSFSFKTVLHNAESRDFIPLLSEFSITETDTGIALQPKDPKRVQIERSSTSHGPTLNQNIPGLGLIEVWELTSDLIETLPPWEGKHVPGGELFLEDEDTPDITFVLVGISSFTRLYPNLWEVAELGALELFSELTVSVRRAD